MSSHSFSLSPSFIPPLQALHWPAFTDAGVSLKVLRLDLIDPLLGGNKWFKLQRNIEAIRAAGNPRVLTFGGAWSNHLRAVAAAGQRFGFETVGLVRGELVEPLNPSLCLARGCGMHLQAMTRSDYRRKHEPDMLAWLEQEFGPHYLIPEGGSNAAGVQGCEMLADYLCWDHSAGHRVVALACGTGATMAGLIRGLQGKKQVVHVLGVAVLKADGYIPDQVRRWLGEESARPVSWQVIEDAHCGGYARSSVELEMFLEEFAGCSDMPVEPVYTGKLLFALHRQLGRGRFLPGTEIILLHTGGILPGNSRESDEKTVR